MDPLEAPLISVIMPAYNTEKYIGEAIQSILDQTYTHFELLICDDGSTDQTYTIAEHYASIDARIKLFRNKQNIGNLKTTNFLFDQCEGEYIAIQDSDDYSDRERLLLSLNAFKEYWDLGVIGTNYFTTDNKLNPISCGFLPSNDPEIKRAMDYEVPPLLYGSIMVKKELIVIVGGFKSVFNRKGYADLDWLCRICEITKTKNLRELCYYYRKHEHHENSPQNYVAKHGSELIVEAHKQRMRGEIDFLASKNYFLIYKFIGKLYKNQANQAYWQENEHEARKLFFKSFLLFPMDGYVLKSLVKLTLRMKL